jgi:hypothetical protein
MPSGDRLDATHKHAAPTRYSAESISLRKLLSDGHTARRGSGFGRRAFLRHFGSGQKPINFGNLSFGSL